MFEITSSGSFDSTESWLKQLAKKNIFANLDHFGQKGVDALARNTPKETGLSADSWYYEILEEPGSWSIVWGNTHVVNGTPVVILLQLGHYTRTGGYVQGRDFINTALQPIFDEIERAAWKVVTSK